MIAKMDPSNLHHHQVPSAHVDHFQTYGYAIVKGVFSPPEVCELQAAFDRVYAEGLTHPTSFRHGNLFYRITEDAHCGRIVRYAQWPSYHDPVLNRFRQDSRLFQLISPLLGEDIKQIINQLHWKPSGAAAEFGYHQDIRFRRPRWAYRDPANCYVQTGIAVDPHRPENGAMRIFPGSHRLPELRFGGGRVMDTPLNDALLAEAGLAPQSGIDLVLEPGDVALWHLHLVHGSGPNTSGGDRRFYINGYVKASMCDRGEWTFRDGAPVALGAPVLVHYEDLYRRREPHYVDS